MIPKLLIRNLLLTAALLVAAVIVGSLVGTIVAHTTYPARISPGSSGRAYFGHEGDILRAGVRGTITGFLCWVSVIVAQVVFLVEQLRPEPPLAKPVEQT